MIAQSKHNQIFLENDPDMMWDESKLISQSQQRSGSLESETQTLSSQGSSIVTDSQSTSTLKVFSLDGNNIRRNMRPFNKERSPSQSEIDKPPPLASYMCTLPLLSNHTVDHATIGNVAVADALGLYFPLSDIDMSPFLGVTSLPCSNVKTTYLPSLDVVDVSGAWVTDPWQYTGIVRDVHHFVAPTVQNVHSVAGVTIIHQSPACVWDYLRDPALRYIYDRTLHSLHILKKINDQTDLIHLQMQVRQCLFRQQRDVLMVTSHRQLGPHRYITSSRSTEDPKCPVNPRIPRLRLQLASFVVEPIALGSTSQSFGENQTDTESDQNPVTCCKVTYILQIELNNLPESIVHYIIKRQPLCLAYLKEKLGWN